MRDYILSFAEEFDFQPEATSCFLAAYDHLMSLPALQQGFQALLGRYEADMNCDYAQQRADLTALSEQAGLPDETCQFLLLMCMSKKLKHRYQEAGLEEAMWHTSMLDLKYKLDECWLVRQVWGTFVPFWFPNCFRMRRFGFGKLQFQPNTLDVRYEKDGLILPADTMSLEVHIPRTGGRLDEASRKEAYAQAAVFYRAHFPELFGQGPMVFRCYSWLLFPKHREVLAPGTNLRAFFDDFDIVEDGLYENYGEVWRLFDRNYDGNVDHLPQDSSLRRTYANWIRNGEKTGWGYGIYVYDRGIAK